MPDYEVEAFVAPDLDRPVSAERIEAAVRFVLHEERIPSATMSLAFLEDGAIAALNEQFLGHVGPTDVLSFALNGPGEPPHGDVYVGGAQASRQAEEYGLDAADEWLRLAIHGTLHVLGYDHPAGAEREESPMYRRQEALLASFLEVHP